MNQKKLSIILLALLAILVTLVYFSRGAQFNSTEKEALASLGFYWFDKERLLQETPIKTLKGKDVSLESASDSWQLVNFGYMYCPDICPINLRFLSELKREWQSKNTTELTLTHITFDPERDTPDRLQAYLDYYDSELIGLTGNLENIKALAKSLNVVFIHEKPDEYGNYFIAHSDSIALLNPEGKFVGMFKGPYDLNKAYKALVTVIN